MTNYTPAGPMSADGSTPEVRLFADWSDSDKIQALEERLARKDIPKDFFKQLETEYVRSEARRLVELKANPQPPLVRVSIEELLKRASPEWWIEGVFQKNSIAGIAAPGGLGKTFLSLHISFCIATGHDFFGIPVKKGRVLYCPAEGADAFGDRMRAWVDYYGKTPDPGSIDVIEEGVDLSNPMSVDALIRDVQKYETDFVFIDTMSQLGGIRNELDNSQISDVLKEVKRIRLARPGMTVCVIHHTSAEGERYRGGTAFHDNLDTLIMGRGDSNHFSISTEANRHGKQKDAKRFDLTGFRLTDHLNSAVVTQDAEKPKDEAWQLVIDTLEHKRWYSAKELREACGVNDTSGKDYEAHKKNRKRWADDGLLEVQGSGNALQFRILPFITSRGVRIPPSPVRAGGDS